MAPKNNTINFFDVLITLARHKVFLITTILGITFFALIISLVWPKKYQSSAEIIQTRESMGSFGGILQNLGSLSSGQSKIGGETILVILNSDNLKNKLIDEFNLDEVYGTPIKEALYETLNGAISIEEVREGGFGFNPIVSVKIRVEDKEPERAQAMNQFILNELDAKMQELNMKSASDNLKIIKERFKVNQQNLKQAEEELNNFQNKYGILEVSNQVQALIENLARVKTNIVQNEVELRVLSQRLDENAPLVLQKQQELQALNKTYNTLVRQSETLDESEDAFYSLYDMPDLMLTYMRLMREVEVQNKIYEFLLPQIEQQNLYLANKSSGLQVIDKADLPTYKSSPKRAFIVVGGFLFALFFSLLIILFRELYYAEGSVYQSKIDLLKNELSFRKTK